MGGPGYSCVLLFLILELKPQPGVSQMANLLKHCKECKNFLKNDDVTPNFYRNLITKANYTICPNSVIKFVLPKGIYCGIRSESWVDEVTNLIDQGRNPGLQPVENQQDFSKGSKDKPPTTTQESTSTARIVPSLRLSTQTWKGGTAKPSETTTEKLRTTPDILEITMGLTTTAPNPDHNNGLLHGNEAPIKEDDQKSKMKQMTIAVISLILIVLVLTAVGVYAWCQRVRFTKCKTHCTEEIVKYQPTPSEEQI
ncbi:hypothetical protein GDO78_018866 [Eleutherodactylus coqui]|uniref:Uncharacterized protein n=1 Tax=Eleutherodactylus coqui TaxID=57060 RepID=A0A8J6ECJ9_ELECQ|nr:hypothetical protein GDO78_018866 [Eleutherodactylus coqui]